MNERKVGLDYLKALSAIMIILFHYEYNSGFDWTNFSGIQRVLIDCIYMFGEIAVNCFMLCSGYLMIGKNSKQPHYKKVTKIWLKVLFYSVSTALLVHFLLKPYDFSLKTIFSIIFPISFNVWWYTSAYFIIFLLSPFINKMLVSLSKEEYRKFIFVLVGFFSVVPTILGIVNNNSESLAGFNRLIWLFIIYSIAGYIKLYGFDFIKKNKQKCFWRLLHIGTWSFLLVFFLLLEKFPNLLFGLADARYFWRPNSVPVLLISLSLFMMFLNANVMPKKIVTLISASTLGIYQMHGGRSAQLWWRSIFHKHIVQGSWAMFLEMLIAVVVISICGIIMESIWNFIEKHIINRLLVKAAYKTKVDP